MTRLHFLLLFSAGFSIWRAQAARNIQVGDDDGIIVYEPAGSWAEQDESMDIGGTHKVTESATATATLRFTGTAVYFYAPLWPYAVGTTVSLDGSSTLLDLQDHAQPLALESAATTASHIVWQATGLDNVEHILRISTGNGIAVVDSIVYTVPDPQDLLPTGSSTTSSSTTTSGTTSTTPVPTEEPPKPSPSTTPGTKRGLSIALGIVCSIFGVLVFIFAWRWWRRRARDDERKTLEYEAPAEPSNESYPSMAQIESPTTPPSRPSTVIPPPVPIPPVSAANGKSPTSPLRHSAGPMPSSPLNPATASSRKSQQLLSTIHESGRLSSRVTSASHSTPYSAASSEAGRSRTSLPLMAPRDSVADWSAPTPTARAISKGKGKAKAPSSTASSRSS